MLVPKNYYYLFYVLSILFSSCNKLPNKKLGINYYKMSVLELQESREEEPSYRKSLFYINKAIVQDVQPHYLAHKGTLLFLLGEERESLCSFKRALRLFRVKKVWSSRRHVEDVVIGQASLEQLSSEQVRSEILNNYACVLAKIGDKKEALKIFNQLEQNQDYLTPEVVLVNQAKIYYDDGDYVMAKQKLITATKIAHDYVDAHYYLGLVLYKIKEYEFSKKMIKKTLFLEPGHKGAFDLQNKLVLKI